MSRKTYYFVIAMLICIGLFTACVSRPTETAGPGPLENTTASTNATGTEKSSVETPLTPSASLILDNIKKRPDFIKKASITGYYHEKDTAKLLAREKEGNLLPMEVLIKLSKTRPTEEDFIKYSFFAPSGRDVLTFHMRNGYVFTFEDRVENCTLTHMGKDVESVYYVEGLEHFEEFAAFIESGEADIPEAPKPQMQVLDELMETLKKSGYKDAELYDATNDRFAGERMIVYLDDPLKGNGSFFNVFLYGDNAAMEDDAARIHPDGYGYTGVTPEKSEEKIRFYSSPYYFKRDNMIVLYLGNAKGEEDTRLLSLFNGFCGKPFIAGHEIS